MRKVTFLEIIELAKKFMQVFQEHVMEKHK